MGQGNPFRSTPSKDEHSAGAQGALEGVEREWSRSRPSEPPAAPCARPINKPTRGGRTRNSSRRCLFRLGRLRASSERIAETAEIEPATGASASAWEAGGSGLRRSPWTNSTRRGGPRLASAFDSKRQSLTVSPFGPKGANRL